MQPKQKFVSVSAREAEDKFAVMGSGTVLHRDQFVQRSIAKGGLTHLRVSCRWKGFAKQNERDIGWEAQVS